ncbi:MAG TPA: sigma 54-interacting transcriptional regulator [Polyangiaceae bacterium]|nr:sigma 54-interacting transcriptional regulator [Polyangiaceae bacterium]
MTRAPLLVHPRYEVGAELGRGAQGVVVRVVDREAPERALVAKVWHGGRFDAAALQSEFSLLCRLDVPGLVRAHDFGRDARSGACFFVEDFVEGAASNDFVAEARGSERVERLLLVLSELTATLAALHEAAFVHGDLKPEHVRVTRAGRVFLLDLGAAVTSSREQPGGPSLLTPAFAAPERLAGERPSALSELFSLGALAWTLACGAPPASARGKLRSLAPWLPPSLADLIERLLEPHPRDRPESAEAVLRALGLAGLESARRAVPAPVGRERELALLSTARAGVRYLTGGSGVGKSHLMRELMTRELLRGRSVRRLVFPVHEALLVSELVTFLRGESAAWPFTELRRAEQPMLLLLDELEAAPGELVSALDAYRCRRAEHAGLEIIGALRHAPEGAETVELGALDDAAFAELCRRLGVTQAAERAELLRISGKNPGFLLAARGRVPLTQATVLERTRALSPAALELLAWVASFGGELSESVARRGGLNDTAEAELIGAGLVARRHERGQRHYCLQVRELATKIAASLASFELCERAAACALAEPEVSPAALLALAGSAFPPSNREALLERAAQAAERAGRSAEQIDALLALASSAARRTPELLSRLERLTRSAGINHPQLLEWLAAAAEKYPELEPLTLRRQAERAARASDFAQAEQLAAAAEASAAKLGDRLAEALSLGTRGAVALFRADVAGADAALGKARARLATLDVSDLEELARIDHNVGVVALYRDRIDQAVQAFERSLVLKRRLGDRAGVRSCLLNLGLALSRQAQYERAAVTLDEALALARALGQKPGRAWCLAARADVEVRRGNAHAADGFVAEAEAIREAPPAVRADLCLLRGQIALLLGDARAATRAVEQLEPALRSSDAMVDARARLIEAGAALASLPAAPRRAARWAAAAARIARGAQLSELESSAWALVERARPRRSGTAPLPPRYSATMPASEPALWSWLEQVATGLEPEAAVLALLRTLRETSQAERVLFIARRLNGSAERAWGVDLEGFPLPSALERCDPALLGAATHGVHYLRDIEMPAGRGSRLVLPCAGQPASALLVFEHRFRVGCFDALGAETCQRFASLAALALRLTPAAVTTEARASQSSSEPAWSTVLPEGALRRQFPGIIGSSSALTRALGRLDAAVDSDLPVLITGETGTGKELFARALHELGPRRAAPFVAVNCAAIPETLFEAELFGHARGAFTGAERARSGLLARAEGGTLFLDEIGELPLPRQAALLRVLESRRYRPVGSDEERSSDVRIVAATNRSLPDEVERGAFRQDLLYRINVLEVRVPPLRERAEDVPALVQSFLARSGAGVSFSPDTLSALEQHRWPGNVRELEHQVQRLLALGVSRVELQHLPRALRQAVAAAPSTAPPAAEPLDERREVERALARAQGNITHAARALGLTRHGLKKRMLRLGLRAPAAAQERES